MTNTDSSTSAARPSSAVPAPSAAHRVANGSLLRFVLRANALTSFLCGTVLAAAPAALDRVLDTGHPGWVRLVGVALVPFALFVAWLSTEPTSRLRAFTPAVIAADLVWVAASAGTVLAGWYATGGAALVLSMAGVVDLFAALQWWGLRRTS